MLSIYNIYNDLIKSDNFFINDTNIKKEKDEIKYNIKCSDLFLSSNDIFYKNGILENIISQINKNKSQINIP